MAMFAALPLVLVFVMLVLVHVLVFVQEPVLDPLHPHTAHNLRKHSIILIKQLLLIFINMVNVHLVLQLELHVFILV